MLRALEPSFEVQISDRTLLEVAFGVIPGLAELEFSVSFESQGNRQILKTGRVARSDDETARWREWSIDLDAWSGHSGTLHFSVRAMRGEPLAQGEAFWSNPALLEPSQDPGVNLVLISIDTLRADRVGGLRKQRRITPNLDRMAREGVVFREAVSTSNWTLPAHVSMLTGLVPAVHAVPGGRIRKPMGDALETLAERLWDAGYDTAGFADGGLVSATRGFEQGFDRFHAWPAQSGIIGRLADNVAAARGWIEQRRGRRFFLFLHSYQVHMPYTPAPPYDRMVGKDYSGPFAREFRVEDYRPYFERDDLAPEIVRHLEALYDAEVSYSDALIGELLDFVIEQDIAERTCVLVTSDHGEEFAEHGNLFHHHMKLYDELIRVPLLVWCPDRFAGGRVVEAPVSIVDIVPTMLELAGVAPASSLQGLSLVPALAGRALDAGRVTISEVDGTLDQMRHLFGASLKRGAPNAAATAARRPAAMAGPQRYLLALRGERYKLIYSHEEESRSLYDLDADPGERHDIAADHPEVVARFEPLLQQTLRLRNAGNDRLPFDTVDEETLEGLRALGYVD